MKRTALFGSIALSCVALLALLPGANAQETPARPHIGWVQDWSQRQIVFSRDGLAQHPEILEREPRVLQQAQQRWQVPEWGAFQALQPAAEPTKKHGINRDWNVTTLAGRLNENAFPAKYSFDPGAPPDCTHDFVAFGLNIAGTGSKANLVAYNNLYSGTNPAGICGANPTILFAYNVSTVGGKILTSPVLSLDGTQIAFVESVTNGASVFHVLTWKAGGTLTAPQTPGSSMTSVTFSSKGDATSSPWIDYGADKAYVGDDKGVVYQITGVFRATPTLSGPPWPVTLRANYAVTSPVLDSTRGLLMVGGADGKLWQVNTTTGHAANLVIGSGTTSGGIYAPPIVDVTNGTTFAVSANNGTSAVLVQVNTSNLGVIATGTLGAGATLLSSLKLYQPAFSNNYFTSPSSGVVSLCGTGAADTTPYQYAFGFNSNGTMNISSPFTYQLNTYSTAACTGWSEFYNPNVAGGTDFFFFGLTQGCSAAPPGGGCVAEIVANFAPLFDTAAISGGPSGIVVDNYSVLSQASSIYMTSLTINTAYKLTQNGLQ